MTRDEFLRTFKETACVVAELIEEGCYDIPVPLKLVTLLHKDSVTGSEAGEWSEEKTSELKTYTDSGKETSPECLSCIEFLTDGDVNVHIMQRERCYCSQTGKWNWNSFLVLFALLCSN